jgi:hypothetical protein
MICPKCGFEQPESPECARCGIIVSRYRGPVLAAVAAPPPSPPAPVAEVFGNPDPAPVGGGTVYEGPPPAAAGGGTVYQGPSPSARPHPGSAFTPVITVTRKLRFGEVLGESFGIYFKNFIPFTILTAIAFSPLYLFGDYLLRRVSENNDKLAAAGLVLGLASALLLLCVPLSTAMITYGVFQEMRGRSTSLGSCLSVGLSGLLPVISVAFLQAAIVGLVAVGTLLALGFVIGLLGIGARAGGGRGGAACSAILTPVLFIVPIVVWLRFFVAVPAAVEEREGALNAMRRSVFLTEEQRGRIFGIVFVLGVLSLGVQLGATLVPRAGALLQPLLGLVMSSLFATTCAVIYYRLRSFHESIDVDQIASVFD